MRSTKLLRSSTFRLTLVYLAFFVGSALALLYFVFHQSVSFIEEQAVEAIELELNGLLEQHARHGLDELQRAVQLRTARDPQLDWVYLLQDERGNDIAGSPVAFEDPLPPRGHYSRTILNEWSEDGRFTARPYLLVRRDLPGGGSLMIGHEISERARLQNKLKGAIILGGGMMVLLGIAGGVAMSRLMLGRIDAINRTTVRIMAGDLSRRIDTNNSGDEFDGLAHNLNAMLERIERLLEGMRQVTDNVAHDLRTPLNRMRSRLELALLSPRPAAETREVLEQTLKDADGLIATFNAMLSIARIEAGAPQSEWEYVNLGELAADVIELYEPLAEERAIALKLSAGDGVIICGNRQLVAQALANVVDNAIKYVGEGGRVSVRAEQDGGPMIEVADNGPGIPEGLRGRAVERFVRLDPDRPGPGNGLGLSLVNAVAKLHEAQLTLGDNAPGLRVRMTFPVPAPPERAVAEKAADASAPSERLPTVVAG